MFSRLLYRLFRPLYRKKVRQVAGMENLPEQAPVIIAANHEGYLDGPFLSYVLYHHYKLLPHFITYELMWRVWGGPLATYLLGMIPRREGRYADALIEMKKVLQRKGVVVIFPEGSRNTDRKVLLRGKTGAVRLALATGALLIPVGINNTTGHRIGAAFKSLWERRTFIDITFGPAVDLAEFKNREIDKPLLVAATRKLMLAIGHLCHKSYPH